MDQTLLRKITAAVAAAGEKGMGLRELFSACRISPKRRREFNDCLRILKKKGIIVDRGVRLYAAGSLDAKRAVVTGLNRTFGFIRLVDENTDVFVPGRYLMGALPGDEVLAVIRPSRGEKNEGEIIKVVKEGMSRFTAILHDEDGTGWFVRPDGMMRCDFAVLQQELHEAQAGDKVLCEIVKRGATHEAHQVRIVAAYGDAQTAVHCAQAVIDMSGIPQDFSEGALQQAHYLEQRGIGEGELAGRTDLREECIFTIDSASSKDLDDAVSIRRLGDGYELGVHIADVSHYVRQGNALDQDAFERGTSVYFADRVIPMLPPELSNGICSLNPGVDRLAFSCTMQVSGRGELQDFRFEKTLIRSRVKGVYREINTILDGSASPEILQKYDGLTESLRLMKELADILTSRKRERGAPEIDTVESDILLDENSRVVGIKPRARGSSEVLIEEFMLMANEAAATYARSLGVPFVYRVHEPPTADKLENLRLTLAALGIETKKVKPGMPAAFLADILRKAKGQPAYPVINSIVLRSMSKAKYFEQPVGHYGLVLQNYAQFTSPIRRYPDLMIHRLLSEVVKGTPAPKLKHRFEEAVQLAARQSTDTELTAMTLERDCDDCYKAEYMRSQIGEEFDGVISALTPKGMFIALPNSVEGFIRTENLPAGEYDFDGLLELRERNSGKHYRVGDPMRVKCAAADVSSGNVDFTAV